MEILDVQMPIGVGMDMDVLENVKRAKVARAQEKTREELEIINERVRHIFDDYELGEQMSKHAAASNIEFMADIAELQSILGDAVQKNKYQQKITIFIVGFQDVCTTRLQLLNQISEFFDTYGGPSETEEVGQDSLAGIDIEAINGNIQTALDTMDTAVTRLNDLNHDIVNCMNSMHSALTSKSMKNRKKMEKNLELAKEDLLKITEKLQIAQQEVKSKEDQILKVKKQMETKSKELANYKTQLEKSQKEVAMVQREMNHVRFSQEDEIRRSKNLIESLENELQELKTEKAMSYGTKIQEITDASLGELARIKGEYSADEEQQIEFRKEIALQYRVQTRQIEYIQSEELTSIQHEYRKRLSKLLEIEVSEEDLQQWGKEEEEDRDENLDENEPQDEAVEGPDPESAQNTSPGFEEESLAPPSVPISERESPTLSPERQTSSSLIEPLKRPFDLSDEEFWESVSDKEMPVRFAEFREEAIRQINELQTIATQTSVNDEMAQNHREERKKWKEERAKLLGHVQQLQKLQEEAEADADEAMRQLEELTAQRQEEESQPIDEVAEIPDDAARQVTSVQALHSEEDNAVSREQATSPDLPKSLSSVSKKSVASLVEEKRAKMVKRKESASRLLDSSSRKRLATPSIQITNDEAFENFSKTYKTILDFRKHVGNILSQHSAGESYSKTLSSVSNRDLVPDENETEEMVYSVESTLNAVESTLKGFIGLIASKTVKPSPRETIRTTKGDQGNDELQNRVFELESKMAIMKSDYEQRSEQDSLLIQHLRNTISNMKQDNIPSNMQITTNTPSAAVPGTAEPMMTVNQGSKGQTVDSNMTMMFTRIDSEHNTKTLLKSTKSGKINQGTLDSLVVTMEGYNEIAASRLRHLVQKIVHHTKMKEVEMNVRNSNLVTSEVFDILEKMEELQRRRAQNWSRQMDELSARRIRLGMLLQDAMSRLENITGVFLIKPLLSYKGKPRTKKYSGKISTKFNKYQVEAMIAREKSKLQLENEYFRNRSSRQTYNMLPSRGSVPWTTQTENGGQKDSLTVAGLGKVEQQAMWSLNASLAHSVPTTKKDKWSPTFNSHPATVPKLMELDVGRYLHGINTIHAYTTPTVQLKSPRVLPGPVRTYTGISRSGGILGADVSQFGNDKRPQTREKPQPANTVKTESSNDDYQSTAPPTTPASQIQLHRGASGVGLITPSSDDISLGSPNLPRPLPPIQVPSRSRASTRSSLTSSQAKEYSTSSPVKDDPSSLSRARSEDVLLPEWESGHDASSGASSMQQYVTPV